MRSPQSLRIRRVSPPLLLLCCLLLGPPRCAAHDDPPALLFATSAAAPLVFLDFDGLELTGTGGFPALPLPPVGQVIPPDSPRRPALLKLPDGRACLSALPLFYARGEQDAGLRLLYCSHSWEDPRLRTALATLSESDDTVTAYPAYENPDVSLFVARPAELRSGPRSIDTILASVDGALASRLGEWKLEGRDLRYRYAADHAGTPALPRRFPLSYFHLLLTPDRFYLLYELDEAGDRLLVVAVRDAAATTALSAALQRVAQVRDDLYARARAAGVRPAAEYLSEVYFRDQGGAGEYVEFATEDETVLLDMQVHTDGSRLEPPGPQLLFPRSAFLLTRDNHNLRLKQELRFPDGRGLRLADLGPASIHRAFVREAARDTRDLGPAVRCYGGSEICGSPGLAPAFARHATIAPTADRESCETDDVMFSEMNFSGVYEPRSDRIQAGGRFVELELLRPCNPERLALLAGTAVVEFGQHTARRLLFTADREYFAAPDEGTVLRTHTKLRQLTADDVVAVYDWRSGEQRLLHAGDDATYWTGTGRPDGTALRSVHSLVIEGGVLRYSGAASSGLRPDLAASNAMTPGRPGSAAPSAAAQPLLAELLPQGGRAADGTSLPDEEFVELRGPLTSTEADLSMIELEIVRERDGLVRRLRFPAVPGQSRVVLAAADSACFPGRPALQWNGLSLPNEAAVYRLRDGSGTLIDEVRLDASTYARLDGEPRTSLSRCFGCVTAGVPLWRPTDGETALACGGRTSATPGAAEAFRPFVSAETLTFSTRRFTLQGDTGASLQFFAGNDLSTAELRMAAPEQSTVVLEPGQSFEFTPTFVANPWRAVYAIQDADDSLLASGVLHASGRRALEISAVSPTPRPGAQEWFRLCSPDGFTPEPGVSLHLRDGSGFEDEIVPYSARFPERTLPVNFQHSPAAQAFLPSGRCAVVLDPDDDAANLSHIPLLPDDVRLWTVRTSSTIGNGLSSGESILVFLRSDGGDLHLAGYGNPDGPARFGLSTGGGHYVRRIAPMHGEDRPEDYVVEELPEAQP